jgi:hypothetical protein
MRKYHPKDTLHNNFGLDDAVKQFPIIAAKGMGKTMFPLMFGEHVGGAGPGVKVGIMNFEMSKESIEAHINNHPIDALRFAVSNLKKPRIVKTGMKRVKKYWSPEGEEKPVIRWIPPII